MVKPRRSLKRTVHSRRTPPRRRSLVGALEHVVDDRLGHEAGEGVVDALALEGGQHVVDRERAEGREDQRERAGRRPAGRCRRRRRAGRASGVERGRAPSAASSAGTGSQAQRRRRRRRRQQQDQQQVEEERRGAGAGSRAARSRSRSPAVPGPTSVRRRWSRSAWTSWSEGAVAPTTTVLPRKSRVGNLAAQHPREGDVGGRSPAVRGSRSRPRRRLRARRARSAPPVAGFGGGDREAAEAVDLVVHLAHDAARVGFDDRCWRPRAPTPRTTSSPPKHVRSRRAESTSVVESTTPRLRPIARSGRCPRRQRSAR